MKKIKLYPANYLSTKVKIRKYGKYDKFFVCTPDTKKNPKINQLIEPCLGYYNNDIVHPGHTSLETNHDIIVEVSAFKTEEDAKKWIERNCANPNDIMMKRKDLHEIIKLEVGGLYKKIKLVSTRQTYEGERHDDWEVVFEKNKKLYKFYFYTTFFGPSLGQWNSGLYKIKDDLILCKNVQKVEKTITVASYE